MEKDISLDQLPFQELYAISRFWTPNHIDMTHAEIATIPPQFTFEWRLPTGFDKPWPMHRPRLVTSWLEKLDMYDPVLFNLDGNRQARWFEKQRPVDHWEIVPMPPVARHGEPNFLDKVKTFFVNMQRRKAAELAAD